MYLLFLQLLDSQDSIEGEDNDDDQATEKELMDMLEEKEGELKERWWITCLNILYEICLIIYWFL